MKNLVSVSVTSYNQRDQLIRAVESVLSQTYKDIQIIIADDYSTKDDSREVIMDYKHKYGDQIKPIFQKENQGIPRNKNSGFKACDGDYITYLDGDDFYYPEKIERELAIFEQKPWADIVYSNFAFTDLEGEVQKLWASKKFTPPEGSVFKQVYARAFPNNAVYRCELMKKGVLSSVNYYDKDIAAFHDWDSRIRMTKRYKVAYSDYVGSAYVDDPNGISKSEKKARLFKELKYVYEKNKNLLEDLSDLDAQYIEQKMNLSFSKTDLLLNKSTRKFIGHFSKYPKHLLDYRFMGRLLLSDSLIKRFK